MNKTTKHKYGVKREVHQIDASGLALGRLASQIAVLLMGKNKADYSPQTDCGDSVEVSNIDKIKWTGKKLEQKKYYHHSGYPGGLKTKPVAKIFNSDPTVVVRRAVYQMLPANKLRDKMIKRIKFI